MTQLQRENINALVVPVCVYTHPHIRMLIYADIEFIFIVFCDCFIIKKYTVCDLDD